MSRLPQEFGSPRTSLQAEFDLLADEYRDNHLKNIGITGEAPEYFAEYKIADLARVQPDRKSQSLNVLDFGSGIGNSVPYFRKHFPGSKLSCADVSMKSLEIAQTRFPGQESYLHIDRSIPLPDASQDIAFSACVFHHIPEDEHNYWLTELLRVTRPGGILTIYEHNPNNPLTVRAVNTCPLDINAKLIRANILRARVTRNGWQNPRVAYKVFFPAFLSKLRPIEPHLEWLSLGAQYRVVARKPI